MEPGETWFQQSPWASVLPGYNNCQLGKAEWEMRTANTSTQCWSNVGPPSTTLGQHCLQQTLDSDPMLAWCWVAVHGVCPSSTSQQGIGLLCLRGCHIRFLVNPGEWGESRDTYPGNPCSTTSQLSQVSEPMLSKCRVSNTKRLNFTLQLLV